MKFILWTVMWCWWGAIEKLNLPPNWILCTLWLYSCLSTGSPNRSRRWSQSSHCAAQRHIYLQCGIMCGNKQWWAHHWAPHSPHGKVFKALSIVAPFDINTERGIVIFVYFLFITWSLCYDVLNILGRIWLWFLQWLKTLSMAHGTEALIKPRIHSVHELVSWSHTTSWMSCNLYCSNITCNQVTRVTGVGHWICFKSLWIYCVIDSNQSNKKSWVLPIFRQSSRQPVSALFSCQSSSIPIHIYLTDWLSE